MPGWWGNPELDNAKKENDFLKLTLEQNQQELTLSALRLKEALAEKELVEINCQKSIDTVNCEKSRYLQEMKDLCDEKISDIETKAKSEVKAERQRYELLEKRLNLEKDEAKRNGERLQKKIDDLQEQLRNSLNDSRDREADLRMDCDKRIEREKALLIEQFTLQITNLQQIKNAHTDQVVTLLTQHLNQRNDEVERLTRDLKNLHADFNNSKDNFMTYFKAKPKNDIEIPEHLKKIIEKAKKDLKLDTKNFYNFAFVGHVKTGKSSLINAIRGISDEDPSSAPVGDMETTMITKPYTFDDPQLKNVRIYDVPGAGTMSHDAINYYSDKCLCAFDCLIIVAQDALGRDEIDFALQSLKYNQPIAFVRSRFDITMDNLVKAKKVSEINQHTIVSHIRYCAATFAQELQKTGEAKLSEIPIFFVSSYTLRTLMQGDEPKAMYQERELIEYVKAKSKFSRNIVS